LVAFKDLKTADEIKKYLLNVLSRTGGKNKNSIYLYHYTKLSSLTDILNTGFIWLGSTEKMNDYMEGEFINSVDGSNKLFFSCFSRTEENLAMYKMYAPSPDGAMMSISFALAQSIIEKLPKTTSGIGKQVRIVRDNTLTDETIEADVYWAAVAYKDLHTDLLKSETVVNRQIKNPLTNNKLAGFVKLYGWEYEKEVRLCASTIRPLEPNEKIAIPLPKGIEKSISIITGPGFDKSTSKKLLANLKRKGVSIHDSEYDALVDLGYHSVIFEAERIKELEAENRELQEKLNRLEKEFREDNEYIYPDEDFIDDGYHEIKDRKGNIIKKGQFINGKLVDGIEFNVIIEIAKGPVDHNYDYADDPNEEPIILEDLKNEKWHYSELGRYEGLYSDLIIYNHIVEKGLPFFYVVDKKVKTEGEYLKPTFTNFRTLESVIAEKEPDELDYIKTGKRKYDEIGYADVDL